MVIELSGVQFGQKSYAWYQNGTSVQREFDFKSQVWFQTKITRPKVQLPLYYINFDWLVKKNLEIWLVVLFYCLILLGWEKDKIKSKISAIWE